MRPSVGEGSRSGDRAPTVVTHYSWHAQRALLNSLPIEIPSMSNRIPRREFITRSAVAGAAVGLGVWSSRSLAESKSPNEKLNIAMIGTANQARFSIDNVKQ